MLGPEGNIGSGQPVADEGEFNNPAGVYIGTGCIALTFLRAKEPPANREEE